jgi:hypothetical protein
MQLLCVSVPAIGGASPPFELVLVAAKWLYSESLSVHEGGKSLLDPGVILNLTAVRVRRAEMLWCGCPQRTIPNVTPVRSTFPLTLELVSTFAHWSAALRANPVKNVGNDVFRCFQLLATLCAASEISPVGFDFRNSSLTGPQIEFSDGAPFVETALPTETFTNWAKSISSPRRTSPRSGMPSVHRWSVARGLRDGPQELPGNPAPQ